MKRQLKLGLCVAAIIAVSVGSALALVRHSVNQSGLQFSVASLRLQRGDTVVFANGDRSSHNITVRGQAMTFNGGLQRPGQDIEIPFTSAGEYQVICGIHPRMRMAVEVR
jgi:plastocyanin